MKIDRAVSAMTDQVVLTLEYAVVSLLNGYQIIK